MQSEALQESRVRNRARRAGYGVRKSRARKYVPNLNDHGEFMLVDIDRNYVVLGSRFDASLDDIEAFLNE